MITFTSWCCWMLMVIAMGVVASQMTPSSSTAHANGNDEDGNVNASLNHKLWPSYKSPDFLSQSNTYSMRGVWVRCVWTPIITQTPTELFIDPVAYSSCCFLHLYSTHFSLTCHVPGAVVKLTHARLHAVKYSWTIYSLISALLIQGFSYNRLRQNVRNNEIFPLPKIEMNWCRETLGTQNRNYDLSNSEQFHCFA